MSRDAPTSNVIYCTIAESSEYVRTHQNELSGTKASREKSSVTQLEGDSQSLSEGSTHLWHLVF